MNGVGTVSAIYVERPPSGPAAINVLIKDNNISMSGGHQKTPVVMVDVQGKFEAADITSIDHNPINISVTWPRLSGIRVTGKGHNYNIVNNDALNWIPSSNSPYPPTTVTSRGIIANDLTGFNHLINNNTITSKLNGINSFLRAAIYLDNNPLTTRVCANNTILTHKGFECLKALNGTTLKQNNIGSAAYGIYCKAFMSNQDRFENRWVGTYATWGALYDGTPPFNFFYDPGNAIPNDAPPGGSWDPVTWFFPKQGSDGACLNLRDTLTEKEYLIIGGSVPDGSAPDWDARRWLLYKLMNDANLVAANPGSAAFLAASETAGTSTWKFARAEYLFDHAWLSPTSAQQGQIANLTAHYRSLSEQMAVLDQQMAASPGGYSAVIAQQLADKFTELIETTDTLELQRGNAAPALQTSLQNAMTFAQALPQTTVFEGNLKNILLIALRESQGDSLVEADFSILRTIAAQCPELGGISVRRAAMWMIHEEGMAYSDIDWDSNCGQPRFENQGQLFANTDGIQVMPNPAHDQVRFIFPVATTTWVICDVTGRIAASGDTSGNSFEVETNQWASGIYFLTARTIDNKALTAKFSIIH